MPMAASRARAAHPDKFRGRSSSPSISTSSIPPSRWASRRPGRRPSAREILRLSRSLRGLDLAGADVVEMNPNYDPAQISALLAATVAAEILALIAAHRHDRRGH
jgi:agmatinase